MHGKVLTAPTVGSDTDSASQSRSIGSDSATITKVKVGFDINYLYVPPTTTHDW